MGIVVLILTLMVIILTISVCLCLIMLYEFEKQLNEAHFEIEQLENDLADNLPPF